MRTSLLVLGLGLLPISQGTLLKLFPVRHRVSFLPRNLLKDQVCHLFQTLGLVAVPSALEKLFLVSGIGAFAEHRLLESSRTTVDSLVVNVGQEDGFVVIGVQYR